MDVQAEEVQGSLVSHLTDPDNHRDTLTNVSVPTVICTIPVDL